MSAPNDAQAVDGGKPSVLYKTHGMDDVRVQVSNDEDAPLHNTAQDSVARDTFAQRCLSSFSCTWYANLSWRYKALFWSAVVTFLALLLFFIVACMLPETCIHADEPAQPLPEHTYLGTVNPVLRQKRHFIVQLHGDSLMKNPEDEKYPFFSRMYAHLGMYNLTITRYADYSKKLPLVAELIAANAWRPRDALIVLSDSDVTNVDWATVNATYQAELKRSYASGMKEIITQARRNKVHIAWCSPGSILTEGKGWFAPDTQRFRSTNKDKLVEYRDVVQATTAALQVPFIDLRVPFLGSVFPYRLVYRGCVTRDGEHANAHGTTIMARLFAEVMHGWFYEDLIAAAKG